MAEKNEDGLSFESERFDPIKALYSNQISVPYPDARMFESLHKYELHLVNRRYANNQAISQCPSMCQRSQESVVCTSTGEAEKEAVSKKFSRHNANVFTRVETLHSVGPLSLLKRCVSEEVRVRVDVRNSDRLRGHCRGFIIAFDNHFNMVMRDVEEVYHNPLWTSKSARRRFKKKMNGEVSQSSASVNKYYGENAMGNLEADINTSLASDSNRLLTTDINRSLMTDINRSTTGINRSLMTDVNRSTTGINRSFMTDINRSTTDINRSLTTDKNRSSTDINRSLMTDINRSMTDINRSLTTGIPNKLSLEFVPQKKMLRRHLNKLFIKGDSVVCVIAEDSLRMTISCV